MTIPKNTKKNILSYNGVNIDEMISQQRSLLRILADRVCNLADQKESSPGKISVSCKDLLNIAGSLDYMESNLMRVE